jgi:hypothetical protein
LARGATTAERLGAMATDIPKIVTSKPVLKLWKPGDDIPDIEALAKRTETVAGTPSTPKQIKQAIGKPPASGWMARTEADEARLLAEPINPKDTPFTKVALQARKAKSDMRETTPMDAAGARGVEALGEVSKIKKDIGSQMSEAIKPLQKQHYEQGVLLTTNQIKTKWAESMQKYMGANVDEFGKITKAEGRNITDPAESGLFKQINDMVSALPQGVTIQELADTKTAIRRLVENHKASMAKPINSTAEAAGKETNKLIDGMIMKFAGPKYEKLSRDYANITTIENQLSRRLGEITDKEKGTARMGASLMKSAVQSNSDRGTKALFDQVRRLTGIDLVKEAGFAEMAMKAVGDSRINDLLQETGSINQAMKGGALDRALKITEMGVNKIRGDKLDDLIRTYNRYHSKGR